MIMDIDKSRVLDNAVIDSPVMGKIAPTSLSGGTIKEGLTDGENSVKTIRQINKSQK